MLQRMRLEMRPSSRFGGMESVWVEFGGVIYAERVKHTGAQRIENSELFTDYRAEYCVRIRHNIEEKGRVKDVTTGTLYNVVAVLPDPANDMKRILCERVND